METIIKLVEAEKPKNAKEGVKYLYALCNKCESLFKSDASGVFCSNEECEHHTKRYAMGAKMKLVEAKNDIPTYEDYDV